MLERIGEIVGLPVELDELKAKPGRRRTFRARGSHATVIVKAYTTDRAGVVARRVASLAGGPPEPVVPRVLYVDPEGRWLVLSDVPGRPLREALIAHDLDACHQAGAALARWHLDWHGKAPDVLRAHTVDRELEILRQRAAAASLAVASEVNSLMPTLSASWPLTTVIHRDLYEEQLLIAERVGLIDLDDAALGPPELDVGNLLAHVELLGLRRRLELTAAALALVDGYASAGAALDRALVERCRKLSLLRLACLNDERELIDLALTIAPAA